MIKNASTDDINRIIDVHINSFTSSHFSAVFSQGMLQKYFEKLLSTSKYNYVLYDDQNRKILGYVIAGFNIKNAVNEFIKENFKQLMWVLIKNPKFITEKIYETYQRLFGLGPEPKVKCRLYLIAVRADIKGKGVAKKLIAHLEQELNRDGLEEYGLSVRKDNLEAISFYTKNGFIVEFEKSNSIYYRKKIFDISKDYSS
jgi:ribosomal protein S18 acetylase RimI-like enzyme